MKYNSFSDELLGLIVPMGYLWRRTLSSPSHDFGITPLPVLNPFLIKRARVIFESFNSNFFQNFDQVSEREAHHAVDVSCRPQDLQDVNVEFTNSPAWFEVSGMWMEFENKTLVLFKIKRQNSTMMYHLWSHIMECQLRQGFGGPDGSCSRLLCH